MELTIQDVINTKQLDNIQLIKEWNKIKKFKLRPECSMSFAGNNLIYHYQMENLIKCRRHKKLSLVEIFDNDHEKEKLVEQTLKRNRTGTKEIRMFECWRINSGSITFFKAYQAIQLYKQFNATKVLDPTAGWGGRALGAVNCGIQYTGIDTNIEMKPAYDNMFNGHSNINMIWDDCLEVDFSKLDYDFVLTSPPYVNIEEYEHMELWKNDDDFYKDFLIVLINRCRKYNKGKTAINISPEMYKKLTKKYEYELCEMDIPLKEQKNGKVSDSIYIWT